MNGDEVVALVAVVSGALTGLFGVWVAHQGGARDRAHTWALAERARQQERLADAYVSLLQMTEKFGVWATGVRPGIETVPRQPDPPLPDFEVQIVVAAKIKAFGSSEVKARLEEWQQVVRQIREADQEVRLRIDAADRHASDARDDRTDNDYLTPWQRLDSELRTNELHARKALTDQVSHELKAVA